MRTTKKIGIVVGTAALAIVVVGIIHPLFRWTSAADDAYTCTENLGAIQSAKIRWALEFGKSTNELPTWDDLVAYLPHVSGVGTQVPRCPRGGTYKIGRVCEDATCSISLHDMDLGPVRVRVTNDRWHGILGAEVEVTDESGRHSAADTDGNGNAEVRTWPHRPAMIVISKAGYLPVTNIWPNPSNVQLVRRMAESE